VSLAESCDFRPAAKARDERSGAVSEIYALEK
jgi:hypothetical protein